MLTNSHTLLQSAGYLIDGYYRFYSDHYLDTSNGKNIIKCNPHGNTIQVYPELQGLISNISQLTAHSSLCENFETLDIQHNMTITNLNPVATVTRLYSWSISFFGNHRIYFPDSDNYRLHGSRLEEHVKLWQGGKCSWVFACCVSLSLCVNITFLCLLLFFSFFYSWPEVDRVLTIATQHISFYVVMRVSCTTWMQRRRIYDSYRFRSI